MTIKMTQVLYISLSDYLCLKQSIRKGVFLILTYYC